jgi:EpsI family protein
MSQTATLNASPQPSVSARAWALSALVGGLLLASFWSPACWMVDRWGAPNSYYSHGFIVPLVAAYLVWRDRAALMALRPERSLLGLACMLAGLGMLVGSGILAVYFSAAFALILTTWGLCGFLFGRAAMRRLLFPAFILLFMVPPPLDTIARFSLALKLMVAEVTLLLLGAIGITTVNNGSTIYLGDAVVTVGNACSGLRSLISLVFLGVLFATIAKLSPWKRVALFLTSIPIALISNVVRVFVLCLIAWQWGSAAVETEAGIGPLRTTAHDASGYLIFVVAFILLYATMMALDRIGGKRKSTVEADAQADAQADAAKAKASPKPSTDAAAHGAGGRLALRVGWVVGLLALTTLASAMVLYPEVMDSSELRTRRIPNVIGGWMGQEVHIDDFVTQILETNDVMQRNYSNPLFDNRPVQLAVVFSPSNRKVAHPPEVCYTGGGWEVMDKRMVSRDGIPEMVRLSLHLGRRQDLVYYCFKAGEDFTASYYRQQFNIVRNMVRREAASSALVRISTIVHESESVETADRRLAEFARLAMPILEQVLN